jgi:N-acetyl-gamma-glutamyl-phosphate/LysW-gamma-L-alpha-aminoadipyl-6-phosphate reductase
MITASIIGASGYAGGELLRLLLGHPEVIIQQVTSQRSLGEPVTVHHPNLRGFTDLRYVSIDQVDPCDLLFVSLPNGVSMQFIRQLIPKANRLIDLGADFRLRAVDSWDEWYRQPHICPELLPDFVYGLPELHREELKSATRVANPDCEAVDSILSLWPVVKHDLVDPHSIIIDAKMSSSQAGRRPTEASHHAERANCVRSYQAGGHRHTAEVEQELSLSGKAPKVAISATAIDLVRGLLVTAHCHLHPGVKEKDVWRAYREEYAQESFIRIIKTKQGLYRLPEPKILIGTNFCDIGFEIDDRSQRLVVIGAIDNLGKGTSGNAVQCMNVMFGFPETMGLGFSGLHPV